MTTRKRQAKTATPKLPRQISNAKTARFVDDRFENVSLNFGVAISFRFKRQSVSSLINYYNIYTYVHRNCWWNNNTNSNNNNNSGRNERLVFDPDRRYRSVVVVVVVGIKCIIYIKPWKMFKKKKKNTTTTPKPLLLVYGRSVRGKFRRCIFCFSFLLFFVWPHFVKSDISIRFTCPTTMGDRTPYVYSIIPYSIYSVRGEKSAIFGYRIVPGTHEQC